MKAVTIALSFLTLFGCVVAEIDSINEDTVTILEDSGLLPNPRGRVLIKAREACALYGRVPILVDLGFRDRVFACAEPPAVESDLSAYGYIWWERAKEEALAIEASQRN